MQGTSWTLRLRAGAAALAALGRRPRIFLGVAALVLSISWLGPWIGHAPASLLGVALLLALLGGPRREDRT